MKTSHLHTGDIRPGHIYKVPDAPGNVMLDLTWQCNLKCIFCYNPADTHDSPHPSLELTSEILRTLADWGVQEVLYLGGEPTLRRDLEALLELGARLNLVQRLVTNGTRLTPHRARLLAELVVETAVSLQGSNRMVHDRLTGSQGAFERSFATLETLTTTGVRTYVHYSPTNLDPGGLLQLDELLRSSFGDAIHLIDVNRLLPYGEGAGDGRSVVLDEDGWWVLLRDVGQLALTGRSVRVESTPHCWIRERAARDDLDDQTTEAIIHAQRPCWMGIDQLALDPWGHIKLCPAGPPVGPSILDCDPLELWHSHPIFVKRRELSFLGHACIDYENGTICEYFYDCGGGCRSAAGIAFGGDDPLAL